MAITIQKKFLSRIKNKEATFEATVIQVEKPEKAAIVKINDEYFRVDFSEDPAIFKAVSKLGTKLTFTKTGELITEGIDIKKTKPVKKDSANISRAGCAKLQAKYL